MIQLRCTCIIQGYQLTLPTSYIHVMHVSDTTCPVEDIVNYHQEKPILCLAMKLLWTSLDLGQSNYTDRITNSWLIQPSIPLATVQKLFASTARRPYTLRNNLRICGIHVLLAQCDVFMTKDLNSLVMIFNLCWMTTTSFVDLSRSRIHSQTQSANNYIKQSRTPCVHLFMLIHPKMWMISLCL